MAAITFNSSGDINTDKVVLNSAKIIHTKSKLDRFTDFIGNEFGDSSAVNKIVKLAQNLFKLVGAVLNKGTSQGLSTVSYLTFFGRVFASISLISSLKGIIDQIKDKLPDNAREIASAKRNRLILIASNTVGVVTGTMYSISLLDMLGLVNIAKITAKLGSVPILGAVAALSPFMPALLALETLQMSLVILKTLNKLVLLQKQIGHIKRKSKEWQGQVTVSSTQSRINNLMQKHALDLKKAAVLQTKRDKTINRVLRRDAKYAQKFAVKQKRTGDAHVLLRNMRNFFLKGRLKAALRKDERIRLQLEKVKTHCEKVENRSTFWSTLQNKIQNNTLSIEDKTQLEHLKNDKLNKWKIKKININWERVKELLTLGLSVIMLTALVATMVFLLFTGYGTPLAIGMAAVFFGLSLSFFSLYLFKKYKTPRITAPVPLIGVFPSDNQG